MVQSLRAEIAKLQRVLDLLLEQPSTPEVRRPGRPKGSSKRRTSLSPEEFAPKKRYMSAEGKARIAAAQKKRWAAQKGPAAAGTAARKAASAKRTSKAVRPKSRNVRPATAHQSTAAGRRTESTQVASAKHPAKNATKKAAPKKTIKAPSKRPAKQAAGDGPKLQATA